MSIEVSFALGMRVKCKRCRVESTMAMFMGTPMVFACAVQAFVRSWAAWRVRVGRGAVAGGFEEEEEAVEGAIVVGVVAVGSGGECEMFLWILQQ